MECALFGMWTKWNVLKKECDHLCSNVQLSERVIKINFISTFTQVSISSLNVDSLMDPNRDEQTFQSRNAGIPCRPLNETPIQADLLLNSKQSSNELLKNLDHSFHPLMNIHCKYIAYKKTQLFFV